MATNAPTNAMELLETLRRAAAADRPPDVFYTEDVCDLRHEPGHIGIVDRTTADVDSHAPHPEADDPGLQCHSAISRQAFRKFKHDGIPPNGTVLVQWQTKKYSELIPTSELTLIDRALVVGDIVKKDPKDAMSGTVKATSMACAICPSAFREFKLVNGTYEPPIDATTLPLQVSAEDLILANDYREGDLVIYKGWVGRIEQTIDEVYVRLSNGSIVAVDEPEDLENMLDLSDERLDVGAVVTTAKGNLRRGRWIKGRYDPNVEPTGDVVCVRPQMFSTRWMWKMGRMMHDRSDEPPIRLRCADFEAGEGKIYDTARSPRESRGMERSHTPFMSGDKVRFKDVLGAMVKYPSFRWINPEDTNGFDLNVLTILVTTTMAKVAWQDQSEEVVPGVSVVPDYNMEDDNEVWPGEIVVTNEKTPTVEDWIFQPKKVGVVQSVSPADRIAKVKWLPNALIRYNQVGMDEHLEELSLLEGSTLALHSCPDTERPVEDVTLYDIRTIGALSRRRGDFVVVTADKDTNIDPRVEALEWFGEVIDLNLDGTLTVRLGAAKEARDVHVAPEKTMLVYSSDAPSFMGDEALDMDGEEFDSEGDYDSMEEDWEDEEDEGVWEVNGVPIEEDDGEWDTESSASDAGGDPDTKMEDAPPANAAPKSPPTTTQPADQLNAEPVTDLGITLPSPSVKPSTSSNAPPGFDILSSGPPPSTPYIYPDPPPLTSARLKRIRKEHSILSSSLPAGIFVRTWDSRLDLLRVLIIGPLGTPYEFFPCVIDLRLPESYPLEPPEAYFHSWTGGQGPVNPNLYENGKICLSLLGTWHAGEKGEAWAGGRSTILQVLVSILGLVLVRDPYFNEAGFEARAGSADSEVPSQLYSERTYFRSRAFISHALRNGVEGFEEVVRWLYISEEEGAPRLLDKAIEACKELVEAGDEGVDIRAGLKKMSRGAIIMLERQLRDLEAVKGEMEQKKSAAT